MFASLTKSLLLSTVLVAIVGAIPTPHGDGHMIRFSKHGPRHIDTAPPVIAAADEPRVKARKLGRRCKSNTTETSTVTSTTLKLVATPTPIGKTTSSSTGHKSSSTHKSSSKESTETSTSSDSEETSVAGTGKASLFPAGLTNAAWSTSSSSGATVHPLSDATFRPIAKMSDLGTKYGAAPDGKQSLISSFPKGSYTYKAPLGGVSFYAPGPSNVDLTTAKEATFGYSVYFPAGFEWNKGGKLPGLYGGDSESGARGCSGGRRATECFSSRLMWRKDGEGEMYTYLPPGLTGNTKVCTVKPFSTCNPTYGASVGRGAFSFKAGGWTTVSERVLLNDNGKANGELELFVNGKSVISVKGLTLTDSSAGRIRGIQMQNFWGGHDSSYGSPKAQKIYFSDFSVAITKKL